MGKHLSPGPLSGNEVRPMSTVPNSSTNARRQPRVRHNARPAATSHVLRRERLTMVDGVKMFDLGVEIGQAGAGLDPQAEYERGFSEGYIAAMRALGGADA